MEIPWNVEEERELTPAEVMAITMRGKQGGEKKQEASGGGEWVRPGRSGGGRR